MNALPFWDKAAEQPVMVLIRSFVAWAVRASIVDTQTASFFQLRKTRKFTSVVGRNGSEYFVEAIFAMDF